MGPARGVHHAAESLTDITPTLFTRYLNSAKDIATMPSSCPMDSDFSQGKTRRDRTDESTARLRKFYAICCRRPTGVSALPHGHGLRPRGMVAGKISVAESLAKRS